VPLGAAAAARALELARDWVRAGVPVELEVSGRLLKAALRRADKDGLACVAILGDDELAAGVVALRDLARGEQERVALAGVPAWWQGRQA
jgi:histidyl-tRNA synthetase